MYWLNVSLLLTLPEGKSKTKSAVCYGTLTFQTGTKNNKRTPIKASA
jgi:hypothetical protein